VSKKLRHGNYIEILQPTTTWLPLKLQILDVRL